MQDLTGFESCLLLFLECYNLYFPTVTKNRTSKALVGVKEDAMYNAQHILKTQELVTVIIIITYAVGIQ